MARASMRCIEEGCRHQQEAKDRKNACDSCGGLLEIHIEFSAGEAGGLKEIWRGRKSSASAIDRSGVWRFRELLPFLGENPRIISLAEGSTPLVETARAGEWAGGVRLSVKHQGSNPTGSFKDLGMTACITQAVALGVRVVACASTGNTSSSMAAYAARAGIKALLFAPHGHTSAAKLLQAMDFGATVIEVEGSFDDAFRLLALLAEELGLYLVNSVNPFRIEGQKTIVAEMMEQRGWIAPDYIVVPGGNLGNVSSIGKGLKELMALGLIKRVPRLVVIQAEGASPFYRMMASGSGELVAEENPRTVATAIRIGNPANWRKARRALEWTNGIVEAVSDAQISEAKEMLASDGVGCEPASAATVAGVRKLRAASKIEPDADVVAVLTGHQLKDTAYIQGRFDSAPEKFRKFRAPAQFAAVRKIVESVLGETPEALRPSTK
ncbi:MAG: threonine synthase [Candidatus Acidiferrales bacterium]